MNTVFEDLECVAVKCLQHMLIQGCLGRHLKTFGCGDVEVLLMGYVPCIIQFYKHTIREMGVCMYLQP